MKLLCIANLFNLICLPAAFTQPDTSGVIIAWKLIDDFTVSESVELDTNLSGFQIYFPNYQYSVSNTYLGNFGSPSISNVFSDRTDLFDNFIFLNSYIPYFQRAANTPYFNTRKPFSRISYIAGKPNKYKEGSFEILHTQNISPRMNIALHYKNIISHGQTKYSIAKNHAFRVNANYSGKRYVALATFNLNRYWNAKNGGIIDTVFEKGSIDIPFDLPTRISGSGAPDYEANSRDSLKYLDVLIAQKFKLFTIYTKPNSGIDTNTIEPVMSYVSHLVRGKRVFLDADPTAHDLYKYFYFNTAETQDELTSVRFSNLVRIDFKTTFSKNVLLGIKSAIGHEYERYHFFSKFDTLFNPFDDTLTASDTIITPFIINRDTLKGIDRTNHLASTHFMAGFYCHLLKATELDFETKIFFTGEKTGNTELRGKLRSIVRMFKRDLEIEIRSDFRNSKPSYLYQNYYSNHFIWTKEEQELSNEQRMKLSGKIHALHQKLELKGSYYLINNFIYFNENAVPSNFDANLNVAEVRLKKTFSLWELSSENTIICQVSENEVVLPLPDLILFISTYLNHTFHFKSTGGDLQTIVGLDLYYNSNYYGYEYSPALSQFFIQNNKYIGNFPLLDAYLNVKLKSLRFFLKMRNISSFLSGRNYYAALHYPHSQADFGRNETPAFQLGFSWVFYN